MDEAWFGGDFNCGIGGEGDEVVPEDCVAWDGSGEGFEQGRACCEDPIASGGHGQEGCIGLRARGAVQAEATHPEGEDELFIGVVGVDIFCLGRVDIEGDFGCAVNLGFEAAEVVEGIANGDCEFDVFELLLEGSVEEDPFVLGAEGKCEEFCNGGMSSLLTSTYDLRFMHLRPKRSNVLPPPSR